MAKTIFNMADGILSPCNMARGCWDNDIEFARGQHPCNVTLLWETILNSPGGRTLQCGTGLWDDMPLNLPKRPPYWNSTSGFDVDHITAVDMSFCISLRNFIQIGPPIDFRGPIMGSLKSPCRTSYRSSLINGDHSSNCLVFEKIVFSHFGD